MRTHRLLLITAAVALLAGCAGHGADSTKSSGAPVPTSPAGSPAATTPVPSGSVPATGASPSKSGPPAPGPASTADEQVLTGAVENGVEPRCTLLRTPTTTWVLSGDLHGLRAGVQARVRGHALRDTMSYCQQGRLFAVTSATILGPR